MAGTRGAVAAGHPLTAQSAVEVLEAGGNAYDAVLAALATSCVVEPVLSSLGGGGFLLALPERGAPRLYDFFVQTPGRRRPLDELEFERVMIDFGTAAQEFHHGRGTVGVPGTVAGLCAVQRELGTLPLRALVEPAVRLALDGVEVSPFHAHVFALVEPTHLPSAECRRLFGSATREGRLAQAGEVLRLPELAATLEALADAGEELFYRGELAGRMAADMQEGGQLSRADLEAYRVVVREPLQLSHGGARVLTNPAPASGGLLVGFGLELLEGHEVGRLQFGSAEHLLLLADVLDLTARARVDLLATGGAGLPRLERLLEPALLAQYRAQVSGRRRAERGTTHVSVIDAAGNLASMTVSNGEGSGYVLPGTGIVMNNMLGEGDLNPGGFQRWPESHRMTSMMSPSAVLWPDGRRLAVGSGGSARIRTAVLQVLVNAIDFGMGVPEAVRAPRLHCEPGRLFVEGGFEPEALQALLAAHAEHDAWRERSLFFGGAHAVLARGGGFEGAGDERRSGAYREH